MGQSWLSPGGVFAAVAALAAAAGAEPEPPVLRTDANACVSHRLRSLLSRLPLAFEENRGQAPIDYDFLVRCRGYNAFVNSQEVVFSFDGHGLRMALEGAAPVRPTTAGLRLPGRVSYFLGADPERWIAGVPTTRGALYRDAAPGTSLAFSGRGRALEFEFQTLPGVDGPTLRFEGASAIAIGADGALRLSLPRGVARISAPLAWQDVGDRRLDAHARWVVADSGAARIDLSPADLSRGVRIDPIVTYETYLGGTSEDTVGGVAVDSAGDAYFTGQTTSADFPVTSGAYDETKATDGTSTVRSDGFVAKVSASGGSLVYASYLGGAKDEEFRGIAVDSQGRAHVTGDTGSTDYPTTASVYRSTNPQQGLIGVLTAIEPSGSAIAFSTYVQYRAWGLALGASGSTFVMETGHLARYSSFGANQVFSTRIIPASSISGQSMNLAAVASDAAGAAYVVGSTSMTNYPLTSGAYRTFLSGRDAFVTKIDGTGAVVYATLLGGSGPDYAEAIGVNWNGHALVAGTTQSADFPASTDAWRTSRAGLVDGFLARLNPSGTALVRSTFLGGDVKIGGMAVHPSGGVVLCGTTTDANFPVSDSFQSTLAGSGTQDGFVMRFDPDGALDFSSFCGGSGEDLLRHAAMGPDGSAVFQGNTLSTDLSVENALQDTLSGAGTYDMFALGIPDDLPTTLTSPALDDVELLQWTVNRPFSSTFVPGGGLEPFSFTLGSGGLPPGLTLSAEGVLSGTPSTPGDYSFVVDVVDVCEKTGTANVTVRINPLPTIPVESMQDWTIGVPCEQSIGTSGGTAPFAFALLSGETPMGTALTAAGSIVGTPEAVEEASFSVQATDAAGAVVGRALTFRINEIPALEAASLPQCTQGRPYSFQLTCSGGTPPLTWSLVSGRAPAPLSATTGALTGTTTTPGLLEFRIRVVDAVGAATERDYSAQVNRFPSIPTSSLPVGASGRPYAARLAVADGTPPHSWSVQGGQLPTGLSMEESTGEILGISTLPDGGYVEFRCTDACGAQASRGLRLDVAAALDLRKGRSAARLVFDQSGAPILYYFEALAGSSLSVKLKGGAMEGVLPSLALTGPSGESRDLAAWTTATRKALTVKAFPIPATGRYFLALTPAPGFVGEVRLSLTLGSRALWAASADLQSDESSELSFSAPPGARVAVSVRSPKRESASPRIVSILDGDGRDLVTSGTAKSKGRSVHFSSRTPLTGGDYRLVFGVQGAFPGRLDAVVKLRLPKTNLFALLDLPAGD